MRRSMNSVHHWKTVLDKQILVGLSLLFWTAGVMRQIHFGTSIRNLYWSKAGGEDGDESPSPASLYYIYCTCQQWLQKSVDSQQMKQMEPSGHCQPAFLDWAVCLVCGGHAGCGDLATGSKDRLPDSLRTLRLHKELFTVKLDLCTCRSLNWRTSCCAALHLLSWAPVAAAAAERRSPGY